MDLRLENKKALVLASSQGIGKGIAQSLINEGAKVVINSSSQERLAKTEKEIGAFGRVVKDHSSKNAGKELVEEAAEILGGLDILVLNGGGPPTGRFEELESDTWRESFTDVWMTPIEAIQTALPLLKKSASGRILLITSLVAKEPLAQLTISSAYRAGLLALVKTLGEQFGPDGITINSIMPGYTKTERLKHVRVDLDALAESIPMKRLGSPEELGAFAAFLASEQGAYFTGQAFAYDGGAIKGV